MQPRAHKKSWRWLGLGAGLLFAASFAVHCGTSGESTFDENCRAMYGDACGVPCTGSGEGQCSPGLHCQNGGCTAECGPGRACTGGLACSASGLCAAGEFGGDTGPGPSPNDDGSTPLGDGSCGDLSVTLGKKTPTIMLLVDRSGSMDAPFGGGGTRWTTLKNVLLDGGVLKTLQGEVNFGLSMYSNPPPRTSCPHLEGVPYALNNFGAIDSLLAPADMNPDTPTGESVLGVAGITDAGLTDGGLAALDAGGAEKIILLVTDGDPDYCGNAFANDEPDASERQKAKDISVDAVRRAFGAGIKTYVLAIGSEVSIPHQQEMANTGLGFAADAGDAAPFFRPDNEAQLISQIQSIITGARPCKFTLNGTVQPGFEGKGTVRLNGTALTYGDPNGWKLNSPTEIELVGTSCETVKTNANVSLSATFPCGAVIPGPGVN